MEEARQAGFYKPTWTAIPNFIDTDRFAPGKADDLRGELGIPLNAIVILCAAAIKRAHKRIDYLMREVAELKKIQPDLPLWLIVAGGWETETDQLIDEGQQLLGDRVRFLVRFPRARMPELYRVANVFTLCSLKEMMPIALLEATASGLPCIVNRHPVMEWMIGPGGMAIDMSQRGSLSSTLAEVINRDEQREHLGLAARQHCLTNFAIDPVLARILDYYELVADTSKPKRNQTLGGSACPSA
jgi:glycosyltransferase involved in cell wall biosynthesis